MDKKRLSIAQTFEQLRQKGQIGVMPFVAAGFPDMATTRAVLPALESAGANIIEIGVPFSDPIADGPTIQAAFTQALAKGFRVADLFAAVRAVRPSVSIPLVAMVSYSIIFRYGQERFFADAASAGFDALIVPDLPPPEAEQVCAAITKAGLDTVLLVSPTTTPERRREISRLSSGFVYYMSVAGITGERDKLPVELEQNVRELKSLGNRPVCVGFGISKPQHVKQLAGIADGAIVGSALVRHMADHAAEGPQAVAGAAEAYCRELLSLVR